MKNYILRKLVFALDRSVFAVTLLLSVLGIVLFLLYFVGFRAYIVKSGSMEPSIETGAVVAVDTVQRAAKIGDVVVFAIKQESDGRELLVTHRIVGEREGLFITKGDANAVADAKPVARRQIVGKVVAHVPELGYLLAAIGKRGAVLFAAGIFAANAAAVFLREQYS